MTATVTPPHILDKFDDIAPMSGDNLTRLTYGLLDIRKPPGQLWERVAESTPNLAILSHATTAAIWEVGCRPKWRDVRGPVSRPIHHSGIIRAGERIA